MRIDAFHPSVRTTALLTLLVACNGSKSDDTSGTASQPEVVSSAPLDGASDVALNAEVSVVFSEEMARESLTSALRLTTGDPAVEVAGSVMYADATATFWPAEHLAQGTRYTATVTTDAVSVFDVPLGAPHAWSFTTGSSTEPGVGVPLGDAAQFAILAKSGISTVPTSAITGDIGVSPAAATYVTGFSLSVDASNAFATAAQVTGRVYAADYAAPTPAALTKAVGDMERALTDAAGRAPDVTELGAGDIGALTLEPGVYKWSTGLLIPTDVALSGSAGDVWIFEIAQDLTVSSGVRVRLTGGARPQDVFWQVDGAVDIGTTAHLEGVVLSRTAVTLRTGATIRGRLLAQTAVELDGNVVTEP